MQRLLPPLLISKMQGWCLLISLFNSPIWPMQKTSGSWRMRANECKLNQVVHPAVGAITHVVSLFEQINTSPVTWFLAIDLQSLFSPISVNRDDQKPIAISWQGQRNTFTEMLLHLRGISALYHNVVHGDFHHLSLPQEYYPFPLHWWHAYWT